MTEVNSSLNCTKRSQTHDSISSRITPWVAHLVYPLVKYLVSPAYFSRIEVTGQENIPRTGPVILAPTHRSRWDALIVPLTTGKLASGRHLHYMISANEYKGVQGWFMKHLGGFPVDPQRPGRSSLRYSIDLLCRGEMVVIFPEGDIYRERRVRPLKRGVATIALGAQSRLRGGETVKILPVSVCYSQPYPTWRCGVRVEIAQPLDVANYCGGASRKNSQQLTADLKVALEQIHEERPRSRYPLQAIALHPLRRSRRETAKMGSLSQHS